ncbi:MAG: GldG family protein [Patescibacteria group bacterium]|nr:GldG family protein [Patescibacteria group bacterium]
MKLSTKKLITSSLSSTLIFLAFLIAINFLVSQKAYYLDLTDEKIYTTSGATKDILKNLDKEVNINLYISKDLPVDLLNVKTQIVDFMNQYEDIAGGKLKIAYFEPENEKEKIMELAQKGIPQIQFNVMEKDKFEVKQGFFGMEIVSGEGESEKREAIPLISSIDTLEYDFISAVYSVSKEQKETVAFLQGHNEKQLQVISLEKSYEIASVEIESEAEKKGFFIQGSGGKTENEEGEEVEKEKEFIVPATLIIVGPTAEITAGEITVIDEYIKNGGNAIILSEAVNPNLQGNLEAQPVMNNLNELTKRYGIEINSDLVYDKSNSNITYQQGFFSVSKSYPFWVKAIRENFSDHPSLSDVQSIMFPWVSSLAVSESESYLASPFISTTKEADFVSGSFSLLPDATFYFADKAQRVLAASAKSKDENSQSGLLFVIGDSDFVLPGFTKQAPDNEIFFLNLVDSISNSANLASIRSKNIVDRPIKDVDESEKNYWKFIAIFAMAVVVDIYGVVRIMRRRKRSRRN